MADEFKCPKCGSDSVARSPYRWLWELKRFGVQCFGCRAWIVSSQVTDAGDTTYRQEIDDQLTGKHPARDLYDVVESCPTCHRPY